MRAQRQRVAFGEEEQRNERALTFLTKKSQSKRYEACSDVSCVDRKDTTVKALRRNGFAVLQSYAQEKYPPLNLILFTISEPILFYEFYGKTLSLVCKHDRFFSAFTTDKPLCFQPFQNRKIISLPAAAQQRIMCGTV